MIAGFRLPCARAAEMACVIKKEGHHQPSRFFFTSLHFVGSKSSLPKNTQILCKPNPPANKCAVILALCPIHRAFCDGWDRRKPISATAKKSPPTSGGFHILSKDLMALFRCASTKRSGGMCAQIHFVHGQFQPTSADTIDEGVFQILAAEDLASQAHSIGVSS